VEAMYSLTFEDVEFEIAGDVDLEIALERSEVAELLDRALGLIPAGSRELLVKRCIEDMSISEIAAQRGMIEGAVSVRIHRGKSALREIVRTDLREDAAALGVTDPAPDRWSATRIWCPYCGMHRLLAQRDIGRGAFTVRCPGCGHRTEERPAGYLGAVSGYWRTLLRVNREANRYYRDALEQGWAACACCGRASLLRYSLPPGITGREHNVPGVYVQCATCGAVSLQPDIGLVLTHPAVPRFWREHKRIRFGGRYEIVHMGRDALLIRFDAVSDASAVEVLAAADTFEVLYACDGDREVPR